MNGNLRSIRNELQYLFPTICGLKESIQRVCECCKLMEPRTFETGYPIWIICNCEIFNMSFNRSNFVSNIKKIGKMIKRIEFSDNRKEAYVFESTKDVHNTMNFIRQEIKEDHPEWEQLRPEEGWWDVKKDKFLFCDSPY